MPDFNQAMFLVGLLTLSATSVGAESSQEVAPQAQPQRIIVLQNGRVLSGQVEDVPGGYVVDNSVGSIVIPFTQVRLTAKDLPDAYRKLKAGITEPTASQHVALGQWCYANRLYTSAREQVKAALVLEPERKEARSLLAQIDRVTTPEGLAATIPTPPRRSRDGFEASPPQALGGLSQDVTRDFVRRIQPLLMNKCGNARCHGVAGTSDFRLSPVRLGVAGFRSLTDRNLASVLQTIDAAHPAASPLLVIPQGEHGRQGRIWTSPRADDQLSELRAWVNQVARERSMAPSSEPPSTATGDARPHAGIRPVSSVTGDAFLDEVRAEERPDKFDPAIFNRQVHGRE
jgi:hypothetical protein